MARFKLGICDVYVYPVVEAGTKGGEDLFIYVGASSETEPPEKFKREDLEAALKKIKVRCGADLEFDTFGPSGVSFTTSQYEFEYKESWDKFVDFVLDALNGDWTCSRKRTSKEEKWHIGYEQFIDGNTD